MSATRGNMTGDQWPASAEERILLEQSRTVFRELADLLYAVDEARYVDPAGGFDPTV